MRWARMLAAAGGPSLDDVLRGLLLPPVADPRQQPPATERLFAALEPWLGDRPRRDVEAIVGRGDDVPLDAGLLGPCFELRWVEANAERAMPLPVVTAQGSCAASPPSS